MSCFTILKASENIVLRMTNQYKISSISFEKFIFMSEFLPSA